MRISNTMIYDTNLKHMQTSLANYMETNIQGGTQKKINKPSDDPAGIALVLNSRAEIESTDQYQRNLDTARGWLELTDATLQSVSSTLADIKVLAEQAATESMSPENRDQIATQINQLFGQLLNLSNVEFENNAIFGGHNYTETAFEQGMGVQTYDEDFDTAITTVTGKADASMSLRFLTSGTVGGADSLNYQWTKDGGKTWTDATLPAGQTQIAMDGVELNMRPGTTVKGAVDTTTESVDTTDGTFLMLYPTAIYNGDDSDESAYGAVSGGIPGLDVEIKGELTENVIFELNGDVDLSVPGSPLSYTITGADGTVLETVNTTVPNPYEQTLELPFQDADGNRQTLVLNTANSDQTTLSAGMRIDMQPRRVDMLNGSEDILLNAQGIFSQNTVIRMDEDANLGLPGSEIKYSYSTDGGSSWISSVAQVPNPAVGSATLTVPGGFLELTGSAGVTTLNAGTQMTIHPDRAELGYEVMQNTYIPVNQVGKDIFGGVYNGQTVEGPNIFEAVGQLIAFCENNETTGISEALVTITAAQEHMLTQAARVGGLENRLDLADSMLESEKLDQQARLSYTEDIDLTELLNQLAKDELAYSTVLKSSSMILQTNLTKYI